MEYKINVSSCHITSIEKIKEKNRKNKVPALLPWKIHAYKITKVKYKTCRIAHEKTSKKQGTDSESVKDYEKWAGEGEGARTVIKGKT